VLRTGDSAAYKSSELDFCSFQSWVRVFGASSQTEALPFWESQSRDSGLLLFSRFSLSLQRTINNVAMSSNNGIQSDSNASKLGNNMNNNNNMDNRNNINNNSNNPGDAQSQPGFQIPESDAPLRALGVPPNLLQGSRSVIYFTSVTNFYGGAGLTPSQDHQSPDPQNHSGHQSPDFQDHSGHQSQGHQSHNTNIQTPRLLASLPAATSGRARDITGEEASPTRAPGAFFLPPAAARVNIDPNNACVHCGRSGHGQFECVKADDTGVVTGCPRCNLPHYWEDCEHRTGDLNDDLLYLVLLRMNRPPLRTRELDWFEVWDQAGRPPLPALPWTLNFSRHMVRVATGPREFRTWDPDAFVYPYRDELVMQASFLPRDPATVWTVSPDELQLPSQTLVPARPRPHQRSRSRRSLSPERGRRSSRHERDTREGSRNVGLSEQGSQNPSEST
jgi:hypothetical protein